MYQRSELDYLIYNDPLGYADLILNGDPEAVSYTHLDVYKRQEFIVYGGTLDYDNWADVYRFNVTTSADSPFIETKSLVPQSLAYANSVRINFMDYTNCSSVTLYYRTSSENEYTEAESYTCLLYTSRCV